MKQYREYMDSVRASDTLHQRLLGLEASGKRPVPRKRYGTLAAALALVLGLGGVGYARYYYTVVNPTGQAFLERTMDFDPELAPAVKPDIAIVEPGDVTEPGEKTIGGYEVREERGGVAVTCYYILPYIDYGEAEGIKQKIAMDWALGNGFTEGPVTREEIAAMLGGEDVLSTHLDWDAYEVSGRMYRRADGSPGLLMLNGYAGPLDHFEFSVMVGSLPPTCIAYPESVTQEIRGLTVTADKYDGEHGCDRRVSFMKDDCGYRFDLTSTDAEQAELLVSRLVARIAGEGLALTYTCDICGNPFPFGVVHSEPDICHYPPYEPNGAYDAPPVSVSGAPDLWDCSAPPTLRVLCAEGFVDGRSGNYHWSYPGEDGLTAGVIACGLHPLDFRDAPSLSTADGTVTLNFFNLPDQVSAKCWPDSEWGDTSAASQSAQVGREGDAYILTLEEGGWIYEVTAGWDDYGGASYVFYLIKN